MSGHMSVNTLIMLFFMPLAFGIGLGSAERRASVASWLIVLAMGSAIAAIYLLHEGFPPFPAISSKHKVAYVLIAIPLLGLFIDKQTPVCRTALQTLLGVVTFSWLIQRPLSAGQIDWQWLLPVGTIFVWVATVAKMPEVTRSSFTWPVTTLAKSITASIIALLGGFIGLGQVLLSLSALVGGYTLVVFLSALKGGPQPQVSPMTIWTIQSSLLVLLVQLATFATNLSTGAYLLIISMVALPFADPKLSRLPILVQPFALAGLALVAGIPAILLALRNF